MLKRVDDLPNVDIALNTKFKSFILENDLENGQEKVVGIKVRKDGDKEDQEVYCGMGVVLASGGFSADVPFRSVSCIHIHLRCWLL